MVTPIPDAYWIVPNQLLAGEYPGATLREHARARLQELVDAGIKSFVDLTERHELIPYQEVLPELSVPDGTRISYRRMSVRDADVPSVTHMMEVLAHIRSEIDEGRPVYVHCWGGIGRTGTVAGCWMVQHEGRTADEALDRIAELRAGMGDRRRTSPETMEQREFIIKWSGEPQRT
jgi:protein-tyrosine phosphatase